MRVVVFASASTQTPTKFLKEAEKLGELLAKGGHTCVNGGGNIGGMGALNTSCTKHGGKVVTVIHRRWVVDGEEFNHSGVETVVVDGSDLAERKRKLIENASCIISLPGGLGTLDELFHAVCLKQLSFIEDIPVCLINVDGYFDGVLSQLTQANKSGLIYRNNDIIHSEPTAEAALTFCTEHALPEPSSEISKTAQEDKSFFKIAKALAMLPVILTCYTSLFFKTVNMLMAFGGDASDMGPSRGYTSLPWPVEFFGLIAILLLACKNLK